MNRCIPLVLVLLLTAWLPACGGSDAQNAGAAEEVAEATGAEPSTDATPCEVLSDELIQKHFEVSITDVKRTPSEYALVSSTI